MKQADVIALILYKKRKFLVEKRKQDKETDPNRVTIPGGHVKKGEPFKEACQRELKEELGLKGETFNFITKLLHRTKVEDQPTYYFFCEDWRGKLVSHEAEKIFWIGEKQLNLLDFKIDRKAVKEFFKKREA